MPTCPVANSYGEVRSVSTDALSTASVVWDLRDLGARNADRFGLAMHGQGVRLGQPLDDDGSERSLARGSDGFVASFAGAGWLSLDAESACELRPGPASVSLYVRVRLPQPGGWGTVFFSDFLALAVQRDTGLAIAFLGQRVGSGMVFRELPLTTVGRGSWLDLVLRVGDGRCDFFCDGQLERTIPIEHELCSPFDDVLQIGSWMWSGPDAYPFTNEARRFFEGEIDTVALWTTALTDDQVAALTGVDRVRTRLHVGGFDAAVQAYNSFHDASLRKDLAACHRSERTIRAFTHEDPSRPIYHLTAPMGHIFDPVGAFYLDGRYHVFSYHNIYSRLHYCSLDHYVSEDLVHWRMWPTGPWADSDLDVYGIWLGNHFIDDEGVPGFIYTALGKTGKAGISARSTDGLISYRDKMAVLTDFHHDGHTWKEGDTWYTITTKLTRGTRPGNDGDGVFLFSSTDLEHWTELGEIFARPKNERGTTEADRTGFMEFPYLLSFESRDVLMAGGHPVRYWVGRYQRDPHRFVPDHPDGLLLDQMNPFHCFNPMAVDAKGQAGSPRRIVMAVEARAGATYKGLRWDGVHVLPRTLELDGDHLRQEPVPELEVLRGAHSSISNVVVTPGHSGYLGNLGDTLEIIAEFERGSADLFGLKVRVSEDGDTFTRVFFDARNGDFGMDGNIMGPLAPDRTTPDRERRPSYLEIGKPVRMRVFLDRPLVETFVNGQTCTSVLVDGSVGVDPLLGLDLFSEGGAATCTSLDIWEMGSSR